MYFDFQAKAIYFDCNITINWMVFKNFTEINEYITWKYVSFEISSFIMNLTIKVWGPS